MSPEEIRVDIEKRALEYPRELADHGIGGIAIYGVPLNRAEIVALRAVVDWARDAPDDNLQVIWQMLERGKK